MTVLANLLQSVRLVSSQPRRIELRGDVAVRFAAIDRVTLHIVLTGSTTVRAGNGAFSRRLNEGEYLFVPAATDHVIGGLASDPLPLPPIREDDRTPLCRMGSCGKACLLLTSVLEIDRARLDAVARIMPEIKRHIPDGAPTVFAIPEMFTSDGLHRTAMIAGGNALLHSAAEAMLVNAVRDHVSAGHAAESSSPRAHTAPVAAALRLMYREPEHSWTLAMLAAECGVSRSVFAASFARQLGTTPMAFLTRIRMMRAETLLRENRHSLAEVALLIGYRSETAFNRAFSAHCGVGPGAWRRAMRRSPL
jgi:AraC-like DNA-binding protein